MWRCSPFSPPSATLTAESALFGWIFDIHSVEDIEWTLNFDGSSTHEGGGVGIVLKSTGNERRVDLSYKLDFTCTNNEVEYETLILGLMAALNIRVSKL